MPRVFVLYSGLCSGVFTQMKLGRQILKLGSRGTFYITTVTITIIIIITSEEEMCKCVDTFYTNYVIVLLWKPYIYIRDYIETTMD